MDGIWWVVSWIDTNQFFGCFTGTVDISCSLRIMGSQVTRGLEIPEPCEKHIQTPLFCRVQWFLGLIIWCDYDIPYFNCRALSFWDLCLCFLYILDWFQLVATSFGTSGKDQGGDPSSGLYRRFCWGDLKFKSLKNNDDYLEVHPGKLTWQWKKSTIRRGISNKKLVISHWHVSFRGGKLSVRWLGVLFFMEATTCNLTLQDSSRAYIF